MQMLRAGKVYDSRPKELQKQMIKDKKKQNPSIVKKISQKCII